MTTEIELLTEIRDLLREQGERSRLAVESQEAHFAAQQSYIRQHQKVIRRVVVLGGLVILLAILGPYVRALIAR